MSKIEIEQLSAILLFKMKIKLEENIHWRKAILKCHDKVMLISFNKISGKKKKKASEHYVKLINS